MALAWLRRSSRAVAAFLLLVSMWQMPHLGQDDDVCAPAQAEAHDESKHVFTTPTAAADQEHCAICHWMRSMNLGLPDARTHGGPGCVRQPVPCPLLAQSARSRHQSDPCARYLPVL